MPLVCQDKTRKRSGHNTHPTHTVRNDSTSRDNTQTRLAGIVAFESWRGVPGDVLFSRTVYTTAKVEKATTSQQPFHRKFQHCLPSPRRPQRAELQQQCSQQVCRKVPLGDMKPYPRQTSSAPPPPVPSPQTSTSRLLDREYLGGMQGRAPLPGPRKARLRATTLSTPSKHATQGFSHVYMLLDVF